LDIIHMLGQRGAIVTYSDPFVPKLRADSLLPRDMEAIPTDEGVSQSDCVVIVTNHQAFDYGRIVQRSKLIVDTRNALKGISSNKIIRL
jgi:UDP-N-acetyl-D-glucosamine dehydrogenase